MSAPPLKPARKHLRAADLRGAVQLAAQATAGVSRIAEGVHQSVWSTLGVAGGKGSAQTGGLTGLIYSTVRGIAQMAGFGAGKLLGALQPVIESADAAPSGSPQREAVVAALNGVMGDRLAASANPLAAGMTLRYQGAALDWNALPKDFKPGGKVLILIHGLCMNDLQWRAQREGVAVDHGQALAAALDYTPLYLRYNTGLHTSQNGRELAAQLAHFVTNWPVPVKEIAIVAHSMGGLVTRSAVHYAQQAAKQNAPHGAMRWPQHLKHIVFLGTPHHGAPLERAGNWVDVLLGATPYSKPFVKLTTLRSAGITDLRYGHVVDEDWIGHDRFRRSPDRREPVPLPPSVACHAVAATMAAKRSVLADRLTGDGLVPLRSALGQHDDARHALAFSKTSRFIAYRTGHIALLHSLEVQQQLLRWLTPVAAVAVAAGAAKSSRRA